MSFKKGDFVTIDGLNAVVIAHYGDEGIPEDHIAVYFGSDQKGKSEGGSSCAPEVWVVPVGIWEDSQIPIYKH
ncbi:hypothetical protein [Sporocytophaga myxococcoides]|uniref:hypothetical protein n=1 Tax=Sporocytophaga myxococcoides TaxID=153721 RepID=UPI0003F97F12|nr:hypothetical protein [Sporocytophaga myxococcoides]